jgi:antitoxin MazE
VAGKIVEKYHLTADDELHLVETDKGILLTPFNPVLSVWTEGYRWTNKRFRNTLRALGE